MSITSRCYPANTDPPREGSRRCNESTLIGPQTPAAAWSVRRDTKEPRALPSTRSTPAGASAHESGPPFFSVVVPTFNRSALLPRVVQSVLDQTVEDFELIIVDDGSTDDTAAAVHRLTDPRIVAVHQENRGLSGARNSGAKRARGQYVVFLDDDDEARADWLATFQAMAIASGCAVAWCAAEIAYPETGARRRALPQDLGRVFDGYRGVLLPGTFAVRRDIFEASGGFTLGLPSSELSEFWMRMLPLCRANGWPVDVSDHVVVQINQNAPDGRPLRSAAPLLAAMEYVIEHHYDRLARSPSYLANCLAIAGVSLVRLGRPAEARRFFRRAVSTDPRNWRNHVRLGLSYVPVLARRVWTPRGTEPRSTPTVLFVDHGEYLGGSGMSLRTVLAHLDSQVVRAVASPTSGPATERLVADGLVDERVTIPAITAEGAVRPTAVVASMIRLAVWAVTHRRRLQAMHANGLVDLALVTPAAALTRRPVVVWAHDADAEGRRAGRVARLLRSLLARQHWAAVTEAAGTALIEAGYARPVEVVVVPNPIDPATVLADHEASSGPVRIGFLGTDSFRKGFDLLPEIADRLDGAPAQLLVFARRHAPLPPPLARAWDRLERTPNAEVCGRQPDVRSALARCDVVLCPSTKESFCRVAGEAMLNGIPVVGSDIPAIREVLGGGDAGLLVPAGDAPAFAAAVRTLVADTGLRAQLGAAGRARAAAFAPQAVVDGLVNLYSA